MATLRFPEDWPKGIIKRDLRIFVKGDPRRRQTHQVSPPTMTQDVGDEFKEGDQLRVDVVSYGRSGKPNRDIDSFIFTIPAEPDVEDNPTLVLDIFDQEIQPDTTEVPEDWTDEPAPDDSTTGGGPDPDIGPGSGGQPEPAAAMAARRAATTAGRTVLTPPAGTVAAPPRARPASKP